MDTKQERTERDIFITQFGKLLKEPTDKRVAEYIRGKFGNTEGVKNVDGMINEMIKDQQALTAAIHADLLGMFYDLSQTDTKIQMLLIPIMAGLRRMPQ